MLEGLNDGGRQEIEALRDRFNKQGDNFEITPERFIAENAYTYEGSIKRKALFNELRKLETKIFYP